MEKYIYPILFVFIIVLFSGCGNSRNIFVLLPDHDGSVGSIELSNDKGAVSLDKAGTGIRVSSKSSQPVASPVMGEDEINETFKEALAAEPLAPISFLLYFDSGGTMLTQASKELVPKIIDEIKQRQSTDISVIGHADRYGSKENNFALSTRRAESIQSFLVAEGVEAGFIQVSSHGEGNPLVPTADNIQEPKNRRVEVVVR